MTTTKASSIAQSILARVAEGDAGVITRAILALYRRQTADERSDATTRESNGRGFTAFDARRGSYMGKWVEPTKERPQGRLLSGSFLANAAEMVRKYHKQLAEEASFILGETAATTAEPSPVQSAPAPKRRAIKLKTGVLPIWAHDGDETLIAQIGSDAEGSLDVYHSPLTCEVLVRHGDSESDYRAYSLSATPEPGSVHAFAEALLRRNVPPAVWRFIDG